MTYAEVITALIALLAALISLVSLKRTRESDKRQLDMQEETTRLSKIQREILEREEARRQAAEQQLAANKRDAVAQEMEAERLKAAQRAQGNVEAQDQLSFGIPTIVVLNGGYVPVREVSLRVVSGPANALLESSLSAAFPVEVIAPSASVSTAYGTREGGWPDLSKHVFLLKWLSPSGELLQKEGKLPIR
jgi:multidrug efflux pump subunit AcrA (membrane-fusion protein)